MNVELFSDTYKVRPLTSEDLDAIYQLLSKNILYYEYCPPFVTKQSILDDMKILPPQKTAEDKYYIGFFMTDTSIQNRGTGSRIIDYLCRYLASIGYHSIRLAWVKGNPQSEHFWLKNRFTPIMETTSNAADEVILAERLLK